MPSAPCFVNPKLYGKQKYFSEFSGERKHAEPLLFQPVPSGAALPPGNAASCFPAVPELPGKRSAAGFFSRLTGKEKRTPTNPDRRPPNIICPVFYALQKVSSSAQSACTHLTDEFVSRCAARAGIGGHIDYCSRINDSAQTPTKGANRRPNSELGSNEDAFSSLLCQSEIVRKTKIFFRVFGRKKACRTPAFPACPVRSRSSSGQRRFLFSGGPGITREEKRSRFLFTVDRKRKTDAYQPG